MRRLSVLPICLCFALALQLGRSQENGPGLVKSGQCPSIGLAEKLYSKAECSSAVSECETDNDCNGQFKCCSNGCAQVCTAPLNTGCQQLRLLFERQSRSLSDVARENLFVPKCRENGDFENIQCSSTDEKCWCVDNRGLELAGTRARSLELVNCTKRSKCAGFLCRMLCPYGFELDNDGCPLCQCRNPCKNTQCPAGQECSVEEAPCSDEVCPPLPTCKSPRALDDQCPFGDPLTAPDTSNPFLCGVEPNKPQCPINFLCNVLPSNDYGVCCPLNEKPGECPKETEECGSGQCESDMHCPGPTKCCKSEKCGSVCTKPGNTTLCQQHKMVVELLITKNPSYEAYIPQCDPEGAFYTRQCTTNSRLCWCVDSEGAQIKGTLGPANTVNCIVQNTNGAAICPPVSCDLNCTVGYKSDPEGCTMCECSDPCKDINCPEEAKCVIMKEDPCVSGHCPPIATCLRRSEVRCHDGAPLIDVISGEPITCVKHRDGGCPSNHHCESDPHESEGICCPNGQSIEVDAAASRQEPELVCPAHIPVPETDCGNTTCSGDQECSEGMKCCPSDQCGNVCAHPRPPRLPTMCEYLRDMGTKLLERQGEASLAVSIPTCRSDGSYEPVQCNGTICWCVDDFGTELVNTRADKNSRSDCREVRKLRSCLGLLCRLGCDYGFEMDHEGCPICECRNPCQHAQCGPGRECHMATAPCNGEWCPHIPQCLPIQIENRAPTPQNEFIPGCPVGNPLMFQENNVPVRCDPRTHYQQCPDTHMCVATDQGSPGVCCPRIVLQSNVERNEGDSIEKEGASTKEGQCPYLIPAEHDSCDFLCNSDASCHGNEKCCSNGCGTQCTIPLYLTACQHKKLIAEHSARETGAPASHTHIPVCAINHGGFEPVQCDPSSATCWCVDANGVELPRTRASATNPLNCSNIDRCDWEGCRTDPCEDVKCSSPGESCRAVQLQCSSGPCPPLALCLPAFETGCPNGEPLLEENSADAVECGPMKSQCPSSHRCHLSPLGDAPLCCPKPRDVCYQEVEIGMCKAAKPRWFFDHRKNKCQQFLYGGCGANQNNFNSKEDCQATCPVLSECERIRERNLKIKKTVNKIVFTPKCNKKTGDWESVQCLDALGLCWCVNKNGEQTPGSVVRGTPICSSRGSRNLGEIPICANGEPVYECPEDLCVGATCLGQPNATCRVDPCGHCSAMFFDHRNRAVDCTKGVTACLGEMQDVLDSVAFKNKENLLRRQQEEREEEMEQDYEDNGEESAEIVERFTPIRELPAPLSFMMSRTIMGHPEVDYDDGEQIGTSSMTSGVSVVIGPGYKRVSVMIPSLGVPLRRMMSESVPDAVQKLLETKPGMCPPPSFVGLLRSMSWRCQNGCVTDAHCPNNWKCCLGDCGTECVEPKMADHLQEEDGEAEERHGLSSPSTISLSDSQREWTMKVHLPNCSREGGYAVVQRQGEFSWCVDKYGNEYPHSLTRGDVKCSRNGTIVAKHETGPVCADRSVQPKVCRNECLLAYCPQHPEALCVADPCQDCKVHFVDESGEAVLCQDKCLQRPESGSCSGSATRFYYNQENQRCEEFLYTGCHGNDNNFLSFEECHQECVVPKPVCEQLRESGQCKANIQRWFYNKHSHKCETFVYKGCDGNDNNFDSEEECKATCPDLVYCPWSSVTQELEPCRRSRVCSNSSCPGNAEAVCTVDPCTCNPVFVDRQGKNVECQPPTQAPDIIVPLVTSETRCEHMRALRANDRVQHSYVPECNENGGFEPTQCMTEKDGKQECWCVDEAGIQLPDSHTFPKEKTICEFVPIKSVDVTLSFKHEGSAPKGNEAVAVKRLTRHLLSRLDAQTENEVDLQSNPRSSKVTFTLIGATKVESAFKLEEMVKTGGLVLQLSDSSMAADYRHSHFYYISDYVPPDVEVFDRNGISETHLAVSAALKDNTMTAVTVVLILSVLAVLILIALVALYRRRNGGETPRNSLVSMAFNSPLYGFITRKSQTKPSPYDTVKKVEPIQTVEAEYESIQNQMNGKDEKCEPPPAYETVKEKEKQLE